MKKAKPVVLKDISFVELCALANYMQERATTVLIRETDKQIDKRFADQERCREALKLIKAEQKRRTAVIVHNGTVFHL